jgi:hypothetical protein
MRHAILAVVFAVVLAVMLSLAVSADCGGKCAASQLFGSRPLQEAPTPIPSATPGNGGPAPVETLPFYLPYTPTPRP